jgi:hypothetical protein
MRAWSNLLKSLVVGACVSLCAGGCEKSAPEPEPEEEEPTLVEEPLTILNQKPDVMLLVDTSGSMTSPLTPDDPDCLVQLDGEYVLCGGTDATACNTAVCPTRWSELQAAMPDFLAESGTEARFGLTTFPDSRGESSIAALCRPASASSLRVDLPRGDNPDLLLEHANEVSAVLQGIPNAGAGRPTGGTPTSQSLRFVKDLPWLQSADRPRFVVLLTDGAPNCNEQNAYRGGDVQCRCTSAFCTGDLERRGCLDQDATVAAVEALAERGIQTVVIGFGGDVVQGDGFIALDAMGRASDFRRTCERGETVCGTGDPCDSVSGLCSRSSFHASNRLELAKVLSEIRRRLLMPDPCLVRLLPSQLPAYAEQVVAYVDGQRTVAGDGVWTLVPEGIRFQGATCVRIRAAPPGSPVRLEVRALRLR